MPTERDPPENYEMSYNHAHLTHKQEKDGFFSSREAVFCISCYGGAFFDLQLVKSKSVEPLRDLQMFKDLFYLLRHL